MESYHQESAIAQRKLNTTIEGRSLAPQLGVHVAESYEVFRMQAPPSRGAELIASLGRAKC